MRELGIDFISVFGMPPVDYVELAAELGVRNISVGTNQSEFDPHGYPRYSLYDPAVVSEFKAALAANGVTIALAENLFVQPKVDMREQWRKDLDLFSELGVRQINSVTFEPDLDRNVEQYGLLAEITAEFGIRALLEFVPIFGVADLPTAMKVIERVSHPNLGLVIDTMHVARSGANAENLRAIPPDLVGYVQLCDVPLAEGKAEFDPYMYEACFERRPPGEGELPLADYVEALPRDRVFGLEIPMRAEAERGVGPRERLGRTVAAARAFFERLD